MFRVRRSEDFELRAVSFPSRRYFQRGISGCVTLEFTKVRSSYYGTRKDSFQVSLFEHTLVIEMFELARGIISGLQPEVFACAVQSSKFLF